MKKEKKVVEKIICEDMLGKIVPKICLKDADNQIVKLQTEKGQD